MAVAALAQRLGAERRDGDDVPDQGDIQLSRSACRAQEASFGKGEVWNGPLQAIRRLAVVVL